LLDALAREHERFAAMALVSSAALIAKSTGSLVDRHGAGSCCL